MGEERGSDEVLVRQMQSDNPTERSAALQAWYEQDSQRLAKHLRSRCPTLWEDILQESFLEGFLNITSGRYQYQEKPLIAYLTGIAHNLMRADYRSARRMAPLVAETADGEEYELALAVESETDAIHERLAKEYWLPRAVAAFKRLPERKRAVLDRFILQGKSAGETGEDLGMTPGHVRVELHRGLKILRKELI